MRKSRVMTAKSGTSARSTSAKSVDTIAASEWHYRSATELAAALQARKISAIELLEHTIARIEALDRRVNAVVVRDFERARDAARAADVALARGERGPLLGIPITIKESFDIAGLPTSWGIPRFQRFVPKDDALLVSRARAAGAIVLGKTNVPLELRDWQSYNEVYGTTNNPWDLARTPGGSSGGSAASLAAGFGALSFGADIGGSLRIPAHFCGVYAHKPTLGLVPDRGQTPPGSPPFPREQDLLVVGPLARSAADLALALDVVAGPDGETAGVGYRLQLRPPRHEKLKSFRVLMIDDHPLVPTSKAVRTALHRLSERLTAAGVKVVHDSPLLSNLASSTRVYMRLLMSNWVSNWPPDLYSRTRNAAEALAADDDSLTAERIRGAVMSHLDWIATDSTRVALEQQCRALFADFDVVLCPPMPTPAFLHDHLPELTLEKQLIQAVLPSSAAEARHIEIDGRQYPYYDAQLVWSALATMCGLPATAAPIDRSPNGLPIGVQIIGPYLEDRTSIAFAALIEREFGGFVPPPADAGRDTAGENTRYPLPTH
jgi:amidase